MPIALGRVQGPARFGVELRNVPGGAAPVVLTHLYLEARRSGRSFLARGWRRQGQLVKMQSCEICCEQVGRVAHVAKTGASRNWELDRIVQARIKERSLAMHLQVCNEGVSNG
jgi:hypothetical protein